MQISLFLLAVGVAFVLPYRQARRLIEHGSDHAVHLFLAAVIRENGHRLFHRVPRILNPAYTGTYPLFLHWCLSFLGDRQVRAASLLLNPLVNTLQVTVVYLFVQRDPALAANGGWLCLAFALTPQFFHFSNARVWGLSSRPLGLLFFLLFAVFSLLAEVAPDPWPLLALAVVAGYLIWGVNTFGQQTMVFFSLARALVFGSYWMLAAATASVLVFLALHPRYAPGYLKHSVLYVRAYATDLAGAFILEHRFSIWRDLVRDLWLKLFTAGGEGIHYAYNNAVVIVVLMNPLTVVAAISAWLGAGTSALGSLALEMTVAGLLISFLTSFRATRFLGEPERYVEMASAFATISGLSALISLFGPRAAVAVVVCFAAADIAQVAMSHRFIPRQEADGGLRAMREAIDRELAGVEVRFASNNENVSRFMMVAPYRFIRLWSVEERFGDRSTAEALSTYPHVTKDALETVVRTYRVNTIVLDRQDYATIFEHGNDRRRLRTVAETPRYRLLFIDWEADVAATDP